MNILLVFSLFLGACLSAPEPNSWPYRDSLHPYYYGYPGQTPYVYKASLEDDEEPSDRSRQDSGVSVSSLIHSAAVKQQETINNYGRGTDRPTVIETGSAAPVQDQPGDSSSNSKNKVSKAPAPNVIKPGLVNPPAFPPARRPPPPPQKKVKPTEEDEDEDDEDDEESAENEDEEEEEVEVEDEEEEEEEDDDERRRNEPLEIPAAAQGSVDLANASSLESIEMPQGFNGSEPLKPVVLDETNEVLSSHPVKGQQQGKYPQDNNQNESNEEGFSSEGVEALVPGYVTDQGEVLVPVDTVTGDQPISIVPDPYTPPSRGVPLGYYGYNAAPGPVRSPGRFRQDEDGDDADYEFEAEDEEDEEDEEDDDVEEEKVIKKKEEKRKPPLGLIPATAPTNEDDEAENRFRAAVLDSFPPSRSPYLHPVTFRYNGGYLTGPFNNPVDSSEVFQYIQPNIRGGPGPSPYGYSSAENQGQVIVRRRRPGPGPGYGPRPISVQAANVSPNNNVFYAYTSQQRPQQQPQRRRPTVRIPVSQHIPVPSNYLYHAQRRQQYSPRPNPFYSQGYSQAFNQGYGSPSPYMMRRPYGGEPMYYPRPAPLHNPGEKLKIKSSYELLVEPHTDIRRVRTKKRPSNKNKNKKRVSNKKKTTQQVKRRPVTIIGGPSPQRFVPASQQFQGQQQGQQQVLYRPFYNVQPHQRVPAQGYQSGPGPQGYQGYRQPAPYLSQAFQEYKEFVKGLASGYYGSNTRRPTPVIMQDQPPSDSSSDSGADSSASSEIAAAASSDQIAPEERRPKMSSAAKKLNKVKLETNPDPLNILPRINKKTKTNRKSM